MNITLVSLQDKSSSCEARDTTHCVILFLPGTEIMTRNNNIFVLSILVAALSGSLFHNAVYAAIEANQITVVFLYDDVSSRSPIDIEAKLIDTFQHHNISCTFAVVPYVCAGEWRDSRPQDVIPLTPAKVDMMKAAVHTGVVEVILHGYSHQTISKDGDHEHTEFSGLDYHGQEKKIRAGKTYLEGILETPLRTFYPTWNSYNINTIEALQKLQFKTIFGMEYGEIKGASTLKFLPFTCDVRYLRDAVRSARRIPDDQSVVVVLVRSSDLRGTNAQTGKPRYQEFEQLLAWVTSQDYIKVRSVGQTVRTMEDLSSRRFSTYNSYLVLSHYLYPLMPSHFVTRWFPFGVYLSQNTAHKMKTRLLIFTLFLYLAILVVSASMAFLGGLFIFPTSSNLVSMGKYACPAVVMVLLVYCSRKLDFAYYKLLLETALYSTRYFYYKLTFPLVASFGACIGICYSFLRAKRD